MALEKDVVAAVLRKVADAIKNLDARDWGSVVEGNFKLEISVPLARESHPESEAGALSESDLADIARMLNEAASRDAGQAVLDARSPSKDGLLQLARHLDVRAQKRDPNDKIRDRIIEATIGFRLRSRAVQGGKPEPEKPEPAKTEPGKRPEGSV